MDKPESASNRLAVQTPAPARVPRPANVDTDVLPDGLVMRVGFSRWHGVRNALIHVLILCVVAAMIARDPKHTAALEGLLTGTLHGSESLFVLAVLAFGVFSLGGLYFAVVMIFNTIIIRLDGQTLSLVHAPLPGPGQCRIARTSIKQLYVKDAGIENKRRSARLVAITRDGTEHELLGRGQELDTLRWMERELESRLKLADQPVAGELG